MNHNIFSDSAPPCPPKGEDFPQFPSPVDFSTASSTEIADKYYHGNALIDTTDYKFYADDTLNSKISPFPIQELNEAEIIAYRNQHTKEFDNFNLIVFASTDGVKLLQQFKKIEPRANELLIFLEIDDTYNLFGSVMRVRTGSELTNNKELPFTEIIEFAKENKVEISSKEIKKLIEKGISIDKRSFFRKFLSFAFNAKDKLVAFLSEKVGNVLFKDIPDFISKVKFEEHHWNPKLKNYDAAFIPDSLEKKLNELSDDNYDDSILKKVVNPFFKKLSRFEQESLQQLSKIKDVVPLNVYRKTKKAIKYIFEQVLKVEEFIYNLESIFFELIKKRLRMLNALLCGVFNSVIDTINGIFQIVGLVFLGYSEIKGIETDKGYYASLSIEFFENVIEGIFKVDYFTLFKNLVTLPFKIFGWISDFTKKQSDLSLEEVYYFLGYLIGFVIETIISILFSGGTLTLNKILVKTFVEPAKFLFKGLKSVVNFGASLLEKLFDLIRYVFQQLKHPEKLFEKFYNWMDSILTENKVSTILSQGQSVYLDVSLGLFKKLGLLRKKHWIKKLNDIGFKYDIIDDIYIFVHKGQEIFRGKVDEAHEVMQGYFKNSKKGGLEKHLDEVAEIVLLREKSLKNFIAKYGDELIGELTKHWDGLIKKKRKIDKFGNPYFKKRGVGGHNYQAVLEGKMKIIGDKIPANPQFDEPFIAKVQMYDKTNPGSFVNKNNSTIKINGKQNRKATSMFPENWKTLRIQQESAFAEGNMRFINSNIKNEILVESYIGQSTTGMEIELIFNNGILKTTAPKIR